MRNERAQSGSVVGAVVLTRYAPRETSLPASDERNRACAIFSGGVDRMPVVSLARVGNAAAMACLAMNK